MQHIQDKTLDQLFKSKFEDAEMEPSTDLWSAIADKIEPAKKKKLPLFWMAAATVTVLLTVTLVFNNEEKVHLQGMVKVSAPVVDNAVDQGVNDFQTETAPATKFVATVSTKSTNRKEIAVQDLPVVVAKKELTQTIIAKVDPIKEDKKEINSAQLPVQQVAIASIDYDNITSEVLNDNDQVQKDGNERKGIRNVGDLVNFVVDKVDKRDKKAIRFKTDDDDSSLIGINIGFLKFNTKKKDK